MAKTRIALIGLGPIAERGYLPVIGKMDDVEIAAGYSRTTKTLERVAKQYNIGLATTSFDEALKADVDCAFILTPCSTHAEFTNAFLEQGVDVFCEKPMAWTLKDCEAMVNTAEQNDRILMVGFNRRFAPPMRRAKEFFQDTKPEICIIERSKANGRYRAVTEDIVHNLDLLRYYLGEPIKVAASATGENIGDGYENCLTAHIDFDSGAVGIATVSFKAGTWQEHISITGHGKSAIIEAPDRVTLWNGKASYSETINFTRQSGSWSLPADYKGFTAEIEEFLEAVRTRRKPETCGEDALKSMQLLDEVCRAAGIKPLG